MARDEKPASGDGRAHFETFGPAWDEGGDKTCHADESKHGRKRRSMPSVPEPEGRESSEGARCGRYPSQKAARAVGATSANAT